MSDPKHPYVSRGGIKLAFALETFAIDVSAKVAADVGAATGGFTDVLLQKGASKVYAIDVGYGDIAWKLRKDPRVVLLERTNARHLKALAEKVHIVAIDTSFISLKLLLPVVSEWLLPHSDLIALIKPQFEAKREQVPRGGIVSDPLIHAEVLRNILIFAEEKSLYTYGISRSPIEGRKGNQEFLVWLRQTPCQYDWRKSVADLLNLAA